MSQAHYLVFRSGPPHDWPRAADALLKACPRLKRGDATRACRFGCGFITLPLSEAEAQAAAQAVCAAGLEARAISAAQVVEAPEVLEVGLAVPAPDGLRIPLKSRNSFGVLPWSAIAVVNAACVRGSSNRPQFPKELPSLAPLEGGGAEPAPVLFSAGNIADIGLGVLAVTATVVAGIAFGGDAAELVHDATGLAHGSEDEEDASLQVQKRAAEPEVWLEFYAVQPRLRLRIRQNGFRYEFLGARRKPASRANFALLAADVLSFTPHAAHAGQVRECAAGQRLDRERLILSERDHELLVASLLTRESIWGLPRSRAPGP